MTEAESRGGVSNRDYEVQRMVPEERGKIVDERAFAHGLLEARRLERPLEEFHPGGRLPGDLPLNSGRELGERREVAAERMKDEHPLGRLLLDLLGFRRTDGQRPSEQGAPRYPSDPRRNRECARMLFQGGTLTWRCHAPHGEMTSRQRLVDRKRRVYLISVFGDIRRRSARARERAGEGPAIRSGKRGAVNGQPTFDLDPAPAAGRRRVLGERALSSSSEWRSPLPSRGRL